MGWVDIISAGFVGFVVGLYAVKFAYRRQLKEADEALDLAAKSMTRLQERVTKIAEAAIMERKDEVNAEIAERTRSQGMEIAKAAALELAEAGYRPELFEIQVDEIEKSITLVVEDKDG